MTKDPEMEQRLDALLVLNLIAEVGRAAPDSVVFARFRKKPQRLTDERLRTPSRQWFDGLVKRLVADGEVEALLNGLGAVIGYRITDKGCEFLGGGIAFGCSAKEAETAPEWLSPWVDAARRATSRWAP